MPSNPIEEIIEKLTEPELRKLVSYLAGRQDKVRSHLLSKYTHLLEVESKVQYEQLVRSHIDVYTGEHFYLDYDAASDLGGDLSSLIENSDIKNPMGVAYLCEAVFIQLAAIYEQADDSSGSMGGVMTDVFRTFDALLDLDNDYPIEVINYILEFAIRECNKKDYQGWNWGDDLRSVAYTTVSNKEQAEQVIAVLNQSIETNKKKEYGRYSLEKTEGLKLDLLRDYYSVEAANTHLNNNLQYSSFRKIALEKAMKEKRYEEVRRLAEEGIIQDTGKYAGSIKSWKIWLSQLSEVTGDTTSLIQINEELFFDRGDMDYYRKLKEIIPTDQFKAKIETYIQHFRKRENEKKEPTYNYSVALILKEENLLEDLMIEVKKDPSLSRLDQYYELLGKQFKTDFLTLYNQLIRQYMDTNLGRSSYIKCCQYIDKIIRLDGVEIAKTIVKGWRKKYPRRRAMIEELAKYKW